MVTQPDGPQAVQLGLAEAALRYVTTETKQLLAACQSEASLTRSHAWTPRHCQGPQLGAAKGTGLGFGEKLGLLCGGASTLRRPKIPERRGGCGSTATWGKGLHAPKSRLLL